MNSRPTAKKIKPKKCKVCGELFTPFQSMQKVCGIGCAQKHAENERIATYEKTLRKSNREARAKLKGRREWLKEAQNAFNRYIRLRDSNEPCISCGRYHDGQYHAGHYRTVGANPELRFEELNTHKQCAPCNNHKSGNIVEYRINLVKKIGEKALEWLEGPHEPKKYTIEDLKEIKAKYTKLARELENGN